MSDHTTDPAAAGSTTDGNPGGPGSEGFAPSRRQVLAGVAGSVAAAALSGSAEALAAVRRHPLPHPKDSLVDHIVVLMMENRSFDHFLGWVPGADGKQHAKYPDKSGKLHATHHLDFFQSCGYADPDHSSSGGRTQYNHGKLDGWLRTGDGDLFPIGYYLGQDLHFLGHAAPHWTVCDRYFCATLGPTYPNRFYQHSAQTDREDDKVLPFATMPTIWDRLSDAKVSHSYYYSDTPFTALWGSKYVPISHPVSQFFNAAKAGKLPHVSFVDPKFNGESQGTSGDDHPLADIRVGEKFMADVYNALVDSPQWDRTLLVVNYDEWGGFFDHVKPHKAPDLHPKDALRGFRVPCVVMGPRARRGYVAHHVFDHTSVLKLIEWRFGLKHLTPRDKAAINLAEVLDFSRKPNPHAPKWHPPAHTPKACKSSTTAAARVAHDAEWQALGETAVRHGFWVPGIS